MANAIKSTSPTFVDMQALEARVKANGYTRSRRHLNACRLLNGNYLTVAVSQLHGSPQFGQRYAVRLVETTDGRFYQKNGKNVVEIHDEVEVTNWHNGRDKTADWVDRLEAQIDVMLDLDKQRLSNGNYLTIFDDVKEKEVTHASLFGRGEERYISRTRKFLVVETTDGDFAGENRNNFVKIHEEFGEGAQSIEALAEARAAQARIFAEDARAALRAKAA